MTNSNNSTSLVESYLTLPESTESESIEIICKFVILKSHDRLILVFGPVAEYNYHADLIEKFCQNRDIPCSWASRPTQLEIFDSETQVRGGGYAEIKTGLEKIMFGGRSTAYGKFIRSDLDEILSENCLVDGYKHLIQRG